MSNLSKGSSSSQLVVDTSSCPTRRAERGRGIPRYCRCGEGPVIRTSGTAKNPGRAPFFNYHCHFSWIPRYCSRCGEGPFL
ncbi:unnamed protein product [Brassica oleracea]|uniref:(rape) hypothetical protein n=1 Tax=Brassica napus TaxID=3708 RepID=A0A816JA01_BRANA|nr:unnamed protein product [Brassica napus]